MSSVLFCLCTPLTIRHADDYFWEGKSLGKKFLEFQWKKKKIRLHPENDEMEDMYFSKVSIQGVAVKIIKSITE